MATPLLPNHPDNYMIPSGLAVWFAAYDDDGVLGNWQDLGNIAEGPTLTLTDETLEHESAHNGLMSTDKEVIIKSTGEIKFTLDELVGCNLLYLFRPVTTPDGTAVYTVLKQKRFNLAGSTAYVIDAEAVDCDGDCVLLGWDGSTTDVCVLSADGLTQYTNGVDYTFTQTTGTGTSTVCATIARIPGGSIAAGAEVVVRYEYDVEATSYMIQEGAIIEGMLKIQALNQIGPMFAYEFFKVSLRPDGDMTINPSEWLKQGFTAKILTDGRNRRGTFYLFDCFQKQAAAVSCGAPC